MNCLCVACECDRDAGKPQFLARVAGFGCWRAYLGGDLWAKNKSNAARIGPRHAAMLSTMFVTEEISK